VMQHRKRLILVGWKKSHKHTFPILVPNDIKFSVGDILFDLPKIQAGESANAYANDDINSYLTTSNIRTKRDILTWHVARNHLSRDREIYKKAIDKWDNEHQRLKYSDLPPELITHKNKSGFLDRFKVVAADLPTSHTMMAHICKDGHYYIHPDKHQARSLTVREAARVQSFPDNYFFEGSRTAAFMQIGNAVPPLMAKVIAQSIADQLSGDTINE
ncbi:MAG: DNA cytosine methyltransferase, partial [Clostridiaceae bacterium]|nr:DNA cytosine methyltransferase [Clostridiaceae bacterium]